MRDVQAVHAFVEKHRRRRQSNKVLHGHPSPTHWLEPDVAMDEVLVELPLPAPPRRVEFNYQHAVLAKIR